VCIFNDVMNSDKENSMNILLITPHKGELPSYFLQQQVEMIKSLQDEISKRNPSISTSLLPLYQLDMKEMTISQIEEYFDTHQAAIDKADVIHSFSIFPLIFKSYFSNMLIFTINVESKYNEIKHFLPDVNEPGIEITSTIKNKKEFNYQEIMPGFTIDMPTSEFSSDSKNVVIFSSTRRFVDETKKVIKNFLPDAKFFIRMRTSGSLDSDEESFIVSMTDDIPFYFGVSEGNSEGEIDLLPLKLISKGIPIYTADSPVEKKLYPDYLHLLSLDQIPEKLTSLTSSVTKDEELVDTLHSFSCRFFFFSKMVDDVIRLYQGMIINKKKDDHTEWGSWETLKLSDSYKIKHLIVDSERSISPRKHKYRELIWAVIEGSAKVNVGSDEYDAKREDLFLIKQDQPHALVAGKNGVKIAEIQLGNYLGDDDIVKLKNT